MTLIKFMALFCSINFLLFQLNIRNDYSKQQMGISSMAGMYFFYVINNRYLFLKGGRSPPVNRICTKKNLIDWRNEYMVRKQSWNLEPGKSIKSGVMQS